MQSHQNQLKGNTLGKGQMNRTMTSPSPGLSKKKVEKELGPADQLNERLQYKASNRNMYRIKLRERMNKSLQMSEKMMIALR